MTRVVAANPSKFTYRGTGTYVVGDGDVAVALEEPAQHLGEGNEADDGKADNYNRVDGVGDWGANGNNRLNTRFTINLGYYF